MLTKLVVIAIVLRNSLTEAKNLQDLPAWKAREHLSWFIEDNMPAKYYQSDKDPASFGLASLGPLISLEREWWASSWVGSNAWMLDQLRQSPLRVSKREAADMVILPVSFRAGAPYDELQAEFIDELPSFAPDIGTKPHIVILNHVLNVYHAALVRDPRAQNITFLSISPSIRIDQAGNRLRLPNVVGMPHLTRQHWTQHSTLRHQQPVPSSQITVLKERLSVASYSVHNYQDRYTVHRACTDRSDLCLFHNMSGGWDEFRDSVLLDDLYRASWYVLHPQGDFILRSAWFDTLFGGAIPAVFDATYVDHLPFTDVLDYTRIMLTLPSEWLRDDQPENIIDRIYAQFDEKTVLTQLAYIHEVLHVYQFSLNPAHELIRWDQSGHVDSRDDAFTFTMKALMRHSCKRQPSLLPLQCAPSTAGSHVPPSTADSDVPIGTVPSHESSTVLGHLPSAGSSHVPSTVVGHVPSEGASHAPNASTAASQRHKPHLIDKHISKQKRMLASWD